MKKNKPDMSAFDAAWNEYIGMKPGDAEPHNYHMPKTCSKEETKQIVSLNNAFAAAVEAGLPQHVLTNAALMNSSEALMYGDIEDMLRVAGERGQSMENKNNAFLTAALNDIFANAVERAHPGVLQPLIPPAMATAEAANLLKKFDLPALEKLARAAL